MSSRFSPTSSSRAFSTPTLFVASTVVMAAAFLLREARSPEATNENAAAKISSTRLNTPLEKTRFVSDARALRLLERTLRADNVLIYNADYTTTASFGERRMTSKAHLQRAPKRLNIRYLSGAREGLELGFNERWFWRRDGEEPMQAYVEVALRPDEMVQRRFQIMRINYGARLLKPAISNARPCDVVEVRRLQPLEGAIGPWKRLWIDRQTGLTLRTDSYNHQGKLVMRSQLSNLEIQREVRPPDFVTPARMVSVAQQKPWMYEEMNADWARVEKTTGVAPPKVVHLPPGFAFDSVGSHRFDSQSAPTAALTRFTDGLNVITVFALKYQKSAQKNVPTSCDFGMGTMVMHELPNGISLLAVGDLPAPMLQKMLATTTVAVTNPSSASLSRETATTSTR